VADPPKTRPERPDQRVRAGCLKTEKALVKASILFSSGTGFVAYGGTGGARAAEHLRLVAGELQMADVRQQVTLSLMTEFENFSVFTPGDYNLPALNTVLNQVVAWSTALAPCGCRNRVTRAELGSLRPGLGLGD
jgi:hypothetical protein